MARADYASGSDELPRKMYFQNEKILLGLVMVRVGDTVLGLGRSRRSFPTTERTLWRKMIPRC